MDYEKIAEEWCRKTCGHCEKPCHKKLAFIAGMKAATQEWKSCFLSCSSPYCAGHFPAVKMQGELGNMSKKEGE